MQTEQQRHYYLATLGITSWLARTQLPGASISEQWVNDFVYAPLPLLQNSEQPSVKPVKSFVNEQALPVAQPLVSPDSAVAIEVKSLSASLSVSGDAHLPTSADNELAVDKSKVPLIVRQGLAVDKSSREAPVMRLAFWQFGQVLVVDSLPAHSRGSQSSPHYEQLLLNMFKAMQSPVLLQEQAYHWNWPTLAGVSIDQGWEQAVSAVQHKIVKIFQRQQPKLVLLFGEHAAQMVLQREEEFDALRGIVFSLRSDTKALTSYSLTQMLSIPGCKRDVWQDLQQVLAIAR